MTMPGAAAAGVAAAGVAVAAGAATVGATDPPAGAVTRMIDMKNLLKLEPFSGKREDFETFKWELYVALDILDPMLRNMMELVEKNPQREFLLKSFTEPEKQKAREVYAILAPTCKGAADQYVRAAERGNGSDAWRGLCRKIK